jgi:sialidase-1
MWFIQEAPFQQVHMERNERMDKANIVIAAADQGNPRNSEAGMVELMDGSILMGYQEYIAGPAGGEDNGLNQLVTILSRDGGLSWGEKRVRVTNNAGDVNVYNSNFLRLGDEILYAYMRYHVLAQGQPPSTSMFLCRSLDEGATFSAPQPIWERQPMSCASGVMKRLSSGRILFPIGRQTGAIWSATDHDTQGSLFSDDNGQSWQLCSNWVDLPLRGAMEAHVEELRDGRILMVMRTQLGSVFQAHSADGGETWSKPQTTGLRQPETCPELIRLSTGDLMIVWCNAEYDPKFASHYGKRSPLTVAISRDEGLTWMNARNLADDPRLGYYNPVAYCTRGGRVIVSFTETPYTPHWHMGHKNNHLSAAVFDADWLMETC